MLTTHWPPPTLSSPMAASIYLSAFLLFSLLSFVPIHAGDNQMFAKFPSKTDEPEKQIPFIKETDNNPINNPKEQEPNFLPENENNYGLYAHESINLPPTTVTPKINNNFPFNAKYLPKNYNPVAYVTQPEDFSQDSTFSEETNTNTPTNNNNNYENNRANNYYNAQQHGVKVFNFMNRDEDSTTRNHMNYKSYYHGNDGNNNYHNYNRFMDASFRTTDNSNVNNNNDNKNYNRFGGRVNRVQPQGMSDTRFLENGRYYYDINSEKYSVHPYENALAMRNQYSPRGRHGNHNANSYRFKNYNDAHGQYQDDNNMP